MTLLARDEADIVDAWLDVSSQRRRGLRVATDNRSVDGTTDVLERYAREGHLHLIREPGEDLRQNEWVTRMARMAATDFGADWVINSDADEFWWPRGTSLHDVLAAVPPRYGTVAAFLRVFVPRPGRRAPFSERMTVRFSALAPINDPGVALQADSQGRPPRASPDPGDTRKPRARRQPVRAAPRMVSDRGLPLPAPLAEQAEHKAQLQGDAWKHIDRAPTAYHAQMFEALASGTIGRLLRRAGRRRLRGRARRGCRATRRRHAVARRAQTARGRWRAARVPDRRRSSTRRRTPSRPPSSARPTSCACSVASTRSRNVSPRSSSGSRTGSTARSSAPVKRALGVTRQPASLLAAPTTTS